MPYEGETEGTDAFIRFDQIVGHSDLAAEPAQSILLYCRFGHMSEIAGRALLEAGYTDVAHLAGGFEAWAGSGRPLISRR